MVQSLATVLRIGVSLVLCIIGYIAFSQPIARYNTFRYSVNEGLLQSTITDIAVDKNNFCWISFPNGLQRFDGHSFIKIPIQKGLPDDKYIRLFRCSNGDLLLSHEKGISRFNAERQNFSLVYRQEDNMRTPPLFISEISGRVYCHDYNGIITAFRLSDFAVAQQFNSGIHNSTLADDKLMMFSNTVGTHVAAKYGDSVYLYNLEKGWLMKTAYLPAAAASFTLHLKNDDEIVFATNGASTHLQQFSFSTLKQHKVALHPDKQSSFGRCNFFAWGNKQLVSFNSQLYETDSSLKTFKARVVNFQNHPVADNASIHKIVADNFGNLYLQTVTDGIRKIIRQNYPVKYFGTALTGANNTWCLLPDKKNNKVLTGGSAGLFVYDTLQQLQRMLAPGNGLPASFQPNAIVQSSQGDYYLNGIGQPYLLRLSQHFSTLPSPVIRADADAGKTYADYFGNIIENDGQKAIVQTQGKLYSINFAANKALFHQFSNAYLLGGVRYKQWILAHGNDELIFLNAKTFVEEKRIAFGQTAGVRCFAVRFDSIYLGSNNGIFCIDSNGKILRRYNRQTGMPDECVYAMAFDDTGNIWCSTNRGILRIDAGNNILQLTREMGLQENEFNSNVVAVAEDGEMFFGGVNGVSSFYPEQIASFKDSVQVLLTAIRVNNEPAFADTAAHLLRSIELPYHSNSLAFEFVGIGNNNPAQYSYQYRMLNADKNWNKNEGLQPVRYLLPPGKYVLELYAAPQFDKDAMAQYTLAITIRPPYWQTWWFRLLLAAASVAVLFYFINQRNKAKYAAQLRQLENEARLKTERERISKDLHDNLGAYANAVLYNSELLEQEKSDDQRRGIIGELKFASKDIITSLRETVWALGKNEYTAEECLVRIRNFVQPLSRTYSHIHFIVEGDAPQELRMHYTRAFALVRMVQEALTNSIKHAHAKNIAVQSNSHNGKWIIEVRDDGSGFDPHAPVQSPGGNGLINLRQRAADAGFDFTLVTAIDKGTRITIQV